MGPTVRFVHDPLPRSLPIVYLRLPHPATIPPRDIPRYHGGHFQSARAAGRGPDPNPAPPATQSHPIGYDVRETIGVVTCLVLQDGGMAAMDRNPIRDTLTDEDLIRMVRVAPR